VTEEAKIISRASESELDERGRGFVSHLPERRRRGAGTVHPGGGSEPVVQRLVSSLPRVPRRNHLKEGEKK
jgi:hypothetical protein